MVRTSIPSLPMTIESRCPFFYRFACAHTQGCNLHQAFAIVSSCTSLLSPVTLIEGRPNLTTWITATTWTTWIMLQALVYALSLLSDLLPVSPKAFPPSSNSLFKFPSPALLPHLPAPTFLPSFETLFGFPQVASSSAVPLLLTVPGCGERLAAHVRALVADALPPTAATGGAPRAKAVGRGKSKSVEAATEEASDGGRTADCGPSRDDVMEAWAALRCLRQACVSPEQVRELGNSSSLVFGVSVERSLRCFWSRFKVSVLLLVTPFLSTNKGMVACLGFIPPQSRDDARWDVGHDDWTTVAQQVATSL
jgi:hypothetical protein